MTKGLISDIKRFAVHDGDGIRTTVFLKGCPLKCIWCHNPESISFQPQIACYRHSGSVKIYGRGYAADELLPLLLEDRDFYESSGGGVTLSGGECLMQPQFCEELLHLLKKEGIHTAVDTCGFVSQKAIDQVIDDTDLFLYDIKAMDEAVHIRCTGQSNKVILDNLRYLDSSSKKIEIRIPYVPEHNADQMEKIADFLKDLKNVVKIKVLAYHNYAGSKYDALGMKNTLPALVPGEEEVAEWQKKMDLLLRRSGD